MKKLNVLICAGGGGSALTGTSKRLGFTMAEILLSLTIIGVVAAITLPSLTGNINERTWNTQRKALYARFSQAIALMPSLNGYGTLDDTTDTAAETFVTEGLSKVLKINNICDADHLPDCGLPSKITDLNGGTPYSEFPKTLLDFNGSFSFSKSLDSTGDGSINWFPSYSQLNTKAAAFETQNGESIAVYYNPYCQSDTGFNYGNTQPLMCANFVYDLNGNKGPNTVGKDIGFITAMYPVDPVVAAPMPTHTFSEYMNFTASRNKCRTLNNESRLPNINELSAMFYNSQLIGVLEYDNPHTNVWSSTVLQNGKVQYIHFGTGIRNQMAKTATNVGTWCVER